MIYGVEMWKTFIPTILSLLYLMILRLLKLCLPMLNVCGKLDALSTDM